MALRMTFWKANIALLLIMVALCCGCSSVGIAQNDNSISYVVWWRHYNSACTHMEKEQWEKAIADFAKTVRVRPTEARRVRTYGLHMLEDYRPFREMGICYYKLGRFEEARSFLLRSMEIEHTSRAEKFLQMIESGL